MPFLYIVATPIGNLQDITLRALDVLKNVDIVVAEDTRVILKLLNHFGIKKPLFSYHKFSQEIAIQRIKEFLGEGKNLALVSDAGTPAISDPGSRLVDSVRRELPDVKIVPIPGASAITTALSFAGVNADAFTFLGFPPHKKGRTKFFQKIKAIEIKPIVLYESTHRLIKTLNELKNLLGGESVILVAKELTKIYEELYSGKIDDAMNYFQGDKIR